MRESVETHSRNEFADDSQITERSVDLERKKEKEDVGDGSDC